MKKGKHGERMVWTLTPGEAIQIFLEEAVAATLPGEKLLLNAEELQEEISVSEAIALATLGDDLRARKIKFGIIDPNAMIYRTLRDMGIAGLIPVYASEVFVSESF